MGHHRSRSLVLGVGLAAFTGACFGPGDPSFDPTLAGPVTTDPPPDPTGATTDGSSDAGTTVGEMVDSSGGGTSTGPAPGSSTGPGGPVCGNGMLEEGEECDDGDADDDDECPSTCVAAYCGDGFVLAGTEDCDDGNAIDTDECLPTCVPASCGDGFVHDGVEECDDGNGLGNDGCSATCLAECGNPGGGSEAAENGTSMGVMYCYNVGDSGQVRAQKACESHFGVGNCCVIMGGYNSQQYGQCGFGGEAGTLHWHWDSHPAGHCGPIYVPGDVVSPGWCGVIIGNFLD